MAVSPRRSVSSYGHSLTWTARPGSLPGLGATAAAVCLHPTDPIAELSVDNAGAQFLALHRLRTKAK
jgi:hypothetical protein